MANKHAIGIDLGTEYCCMGIFRNEKVEIIPNKRKEKITPSYVALADDGSKDGKWLVGEDAKEQAVRNPFNTVFDIKRLIGRRFDDPKVQVDIKNYWPHNVINENGKPKIELTKTNGEKVSFFPEEICARLLIYLKESAHDYLGFEMRNVVITVPIHFNETQRQMTLDAARIAGLNVIQLIDEPTAAALAHNFEMFVVDSGDEYKRYNALVFDLGGGTLDISIIDINNGSVNVIGSNGDTHLGGNDFNQRMIDYLLDTLEKDGIYLREDKAALHLLNIECEKAKVTLSDSESATINLKIENTDISVTITRKIFEDINQDIFDRIMNRVEKSLIHEFCRFPPIYHPLLNEENFNREGQMLIDRIDNDKSTLLDSIKTSEFGYWSDWIDRSQLTYAIIKEHSKNNLTILRIIFNTGRNIKEIIEEINGQTVNSYTDLESRYFYFENSLGIDSLINKYFKKLEKKLNTDELQKLNEFNHKKDISKVILVGGSSKIPKIKKLLEDYFKDIEINTRIDPMEIVAYGATIMAQMNTELVILNEKRSSMNELRCDEAMRLINRTYMPFGIELANGNIDILVHKNQAIPITVSKTYTSGLKIGTNNNRSTIIRLYQGDKSIAQDNYFIGELQLSNIGEPLELEVILKIDQNCAIKMQLKDRSKRGWSLTQTEETPITCWHERLDEDQVEQMEKEIKIGAFLDARRLSSKNKPMLKYREIVETFVKHLYTPISIDSDKFEQLQSLNKNEVLDIEFDFPFDDNPSRVERVKVLEVYNSNAKPKLLECYPMKKKLIFKTGDNLYNDQFIMAMLNVFNLIWAHSKTKFKWERGHLKNEELISNKHYRIVPLSNARFKAGFIEHISAESAENLRDRHNFLLKLFKRNQDMYNDISVSMSDPQDFTKFCATAISTFVSGFVLGIGDRHQGNIMLADDFSLLNIDFGFTFGETPLIDTGDFPIPFFLREFLNTNKVWDTFTSQSWEALQALVDYRDIFQHLVSMKASTPNRFDMATETFNKNLNISYWWFMKKMGYGSFLALPKYFIHKYAMRN